MSTDSVSDRMAQLRYRQKHRPITANLTTDEHARWSEQAARRGLLPTQYAAVVIRGELVKAENA